MSVRIGTAGWGIPRASAAAFPVNGSGLERYAAVFGCAEINTTFYRSHRRTTYERWAAATPESFRFAVKAPRALTHERRLREPELMLGAFLDEITPLEGRMGPLLIQLPPSLVFEASVAEPFLVTLRNRTQALAALEPRHVSWFGEAADTLLRTFKVARVAADPAVTPEAARPGGWRGLTYHRLHGSPRKYWSAYDDPSLQALRAELRADPAVERWCVFDNTASGAAADDALRLTALLED